MSLTLQSCIFGRRSPSGTSINEEPQKNDTKIDNSKITVDAYLFDVKFNENGKRRSVRLDVYVSDTLALFTARAYLGKGVAKGVWRPDSSLFYFPTLKEYYSGPLDEMTRAGCASGGVLQKIIPVLLSGGLLSSANDSVIRILKESANEIEAEVILGTCETPVHLFFDKHGFSDKQRKQGLFYLKEFSYTPKDSQHKVVGKRRVLKRQKKLQAKKFVLNIPAEAIPVQW